MTNLISFGYEDESLKTWKDEDVAIIELKDCVYGTITDLAESGRLLSFFHAAEIDPSVTILMLTSTTTCFSADKFATFLERIRPRSNGDEVMINESELRTQRLRYAHVLNRVVLQMADFKKISAVCLRGEVVTPFFGASLAADLRFVTPCMAYDPAHGRHGISPGGGLPFFLSLYIGYARASEILYSGRGLDARELLELGLINDIIPLEDFQTQCIIRLKEFSKSRARHTLLSTKMLLATARSGLNHYFEREAALIV